MHCVGKTVSDLHALLIDYEKGLKDKAPTPQIRRLGKMEKKSIHIIREKKIRDGKGSSMSLTSNVVGPLERNCPLSSKSLPCLTPDKEIWQGAMDEEMNSMKVNEVWTEVDPPPNAKIVRSKWLFKKKTDMDGQVHTYKARLVAKGHTQIYGIDYEGHFLLLNDNDVIVVPHEDAQATLGDANDPFTSISMSKHFADKDISANDAY
ncbi:retrotransposon protein, putative, ty1-copia subclass [Tanacetum coccineum]